VAEVRSARVALVTGGAKRHRQGHQRESGQTRYTVVITGRDATAIDFTVREIGSSARGLTMDVTSPKSVDDGFDLVEETVGAVGVQSTARASSFARPPKTTTTNNGAK